MRHAEQFNEGVARENAVGGQRCRAVIFTPPTSSVLRRIGSDSGLGHGSRFYASENCHRKFPRAQNASCAPVLGECEHIF
jgi:hypothetical protein